MKAKGYVGSVLWVNLDSQQAEVRDLDEMTAGMFVGGCGMASKVLWDHTGPDTDPLGSENVLCLFTGPCTGTPVPTSGRLSIASLSPLTGIWGESNLGGSWGIALKRAGFDGVVVAGTAEKPVYLWICDGKAELRSAEHLWGTDTWSLDDRIKQETDEGAYTLGIGPAGENRVAMASIQSEGRLGRSASRCGLGAVMGAKNLKAIAVMGKGPIPVFDADGIRGWRTAHFKKKPGDTQKIYEWFRFLGERTWDFLFTTKNWQNVPFESFREPWIEELAAKDLVENNHFLYCGHCPVGCVESFKDPIGKRYQTGQHTAKVGALCMIENMEALQVCYDLCQRYGMDSVSLGAVVAFAMEAFEKGLLTREDTDGLDITWGNTAALLDLTEKIGRGEGIGRVMGSGVKRMADQLGGKAHEFAVHIKGNDPTLQDFRAWNAGILENITCSRGGHHFEAMTLAIQTMDVDFSQWGDFPKDPLAVEGQGRLTAFAQNFGVMVDSLVVCKFLMGATTTGQTSTPAEHALWLSQVTGWDNDFDRFIETGERIFNLKRMINVRRGISRRDDRLPPRLANARRSWGGVTQDRVAPVERMLDEYYVSRGWDQNGIPSPEKLKALGLDECLDSVS